MRHGGYRRRSFSRETIPYFIVNQIFQQIVEMFRTHNTAQCTDNVRFSNLLIVILTSEHAPTSPDL